MKFKKLITVLLTAALTIVSVSTASASVYQDALIKLNTSFCQKTQKLSGTLINNKTVLIQTNDRLESSSVVSLKKYTSVIEAAESARTKMVNHESNISVYIKSANSNPVEVFEEFENELMKETSKGDEGDYLRWDIDREYPSYSYKMAKSGKTVYYYYNFRIEYWYLTTLEQKAQVDSKVKEIIAGFGFTTETTEYEKIKAIYDYVCTTVTYADDIEKDIVYTSWSALFNHQAVCQGYAQLMYRMLKEVGISTRVIPGNGKGSDIMHGWNIVQIGEYYYNLDATWDAECYAAGKGYNYFLKGDNFKDHVRLDDYKTAEFYAQYPMSANDYGTGTPILSVTSQKSSFNVIKPKFKKVSRKKIKLIRVANAKKYQIRYSLKKNFKTGTKTVTTKKITYKLKKLKKKYRYFVKFRAFTRIDGEKVYTQWSKIKRIKKVKK